MILQCFSYSFQAWNIFFTEVGFCQGSGVQIRSGDFLLSDRALTDRVQKAETIHRRNFFLAMKWLKEKIE